MSSKNKYRNNNYTQKESETTMDLTSSSSAVAEEKPLITSSASVATSATVTTPKTSAAKVITAPATKEEAQPVLTMNVKKIDKLIKDFTEAVNLQSRISSDKFDSMAHLISITQYLNNTNDPAVFEYFFRFFQRNQNGIMYYDKALLGIHTIQNKMVKSRVSATHACFTELCRVRAARKAKFGFTVPSMKIMGLSESLAQWIASKATNRK